MKKFLYFAFIIALFSANINGAELSDGMQTFIDGCIKMRYAVENNDFPSLTDAKLKLASIEIAEFVEGEDFHALNQESRDVVGNPQILFTPEYAAELQKNKTISLQEISDAHLMRGFYDILTWHASIQPHASASFTGEGSEDMEMLLFSLTGSGLRLDIKDRDSNPVQVQLAEGQNDAWIANWHMPDELSEFTFTITNDSDEQQTFVIAIN